MAIDAPIRQTDTIRLLGEACQRNTSAELHFQHGQADVITARVRMLGMDEEQIFVDRPQLVGSELRLRPRQPAMVYFLLGGTRYAFHTRVVKPRCLVRLNSRQRVAGASLSVPAEVRPQQRRADFRLSLAGFDWIVAHLHRGSSQNGGHCPMDTRPCRARLNNISAGGVGALVDTSAAGDWNAREIFFMSFSLPGVEQEFLMMTELRHHRRIHDGLTTLAGFKFCPWPLAPLQPYVRQIRRFIAAEQRKQLRRGR